MFVIAVLPNFTLVKLSKDKGQAAFDQLRAALDGLFWREDAVDTIGHDDKRVEEEFLSLAIAGKSGSCEFGVFGSLEDGPASMRPVVRA